MVPFPRSWRWENDGLLDALTRLDPTNTALFSVARLLRTVRASGVCPTRDRNSCPCRKRWPRPWPCAYLEEITFCRLPRCLRTVREMDRLAGWLAARCPARRGSSPQPGGDRAVGPQYSIGRACKVCEQRQPSLVCWRRSFGFPGARSTTTPLQTE